MRPLHAMSHVERRAVSGLALIFALRMFGLFLILPVFSVYAQTLDGYTPFLAGVALGAYGLTQGSLQLVFGAASDRWGRKPVIAVGLIIFALGSVVAAVSSSIAGVVLGRALQGAGAIAAAVLALTADLTRESQRTKAMATIGITIGAAFVISLIAGPVLDQWFGVAGIFWMTAALALGGLAVLWWWVPNGSATALSKNTLPSFRDLRIFLSHPALIRLDVGIFFLHAGLTAVFVVIPLVLVEQAAIPLARHWQVYLPVMFVSALVMFPLVVIAERRQKARGVFLGSVVLLGISQLLLMGGYESLPVLILALFVFFVGFNVLESQLPSLISRAAPPAGKGTAIGIYTTFEFFGAFVGGALGGWLHGSLGIGAVFAATAVLFGVWLALAATMPKITAARVDDARR